MGRITRSFEKVNYLVRPAKQVERKLFVELLHRISPALRQHISKYTYVGFGSVFFADFILFHKYLYIDRMICIEHTVPKRMRFNRPFGFVGLRLMACADAVATLSRQRPYLVWLDFDDVMTPELLSDVDSFIQVLAPGSILLVTVDASRRLPASEPGELADAREYTERLVTYYNESFGALIGRGLNAQGVEARRLGALAARILRAQISESAVGRPELAAQQLVNFEYADKALMVTLGFILDDRERCRAAWEGARDLRFASQAARPTRISVPSLTPRERQWIDRKMVGKRYRAPIFEMKKSEIQAYLRYSRHYPAFYEAAI